MSMRDELLQKVNDAVSVIDQLREERHLLFIEQAAACIADTFRKGGKVILAGNGGSLCDAAHFAEELTGFFCKKRRALPAIVLSEPGHLTCTGNDVGFDWVFARGVEAFGKEGDVFIGLSTSGNSKNVFFALEQAKAMRLHTIAFLGKDGGKMNGLADLQMVVSGFSGSDRIQEAHMASMHIIIDLVEKSLFSSGFIEETLYTHTPLTLHNANVPV